MAELSLDGMRMHVEERGKGVPLVLLHGFPLDGRVFEGQMSPVSTACRLIVPDLRGFGRSTNDVGQFTMDTLADDVHAMARELKLGKFVLGGLSMGGYVTLAYARKYPSDLRGVVLIDTKCEADDTAGKEKREQMAEVARLEGSAAIASQMLPKMLAASSYQNRPQVVRRLVEIMESCPAETMAQASLAMRDREDHAWHLRSMACPMLILCGEGDVITPPAMAEFMHRETPRSKLVIVPDAGHMAVMEKPDEVSRALTEYMAEFAPGQSRPK